MNHHALETNPIFHQTFHHSRYSDISRLVELKAQQGVRISLAFPTLNEEATIGKEILILKAELMDRVSLLDEIVVIDSGSIDRTRSIATSFGAKVYESKHILPKYGTYKGKGENLWKSLYILTGDIIVWIDADIHNIAPKFVYGLVGPLLENPEIGYVKALYERPLKTSSGFSPTGGGRVTEILVRPLFSLFYPELSYLIQPLSGEYAGRRHLLEQLPFSVGYGVELGHLIDIYHLFGQNVLAQVDLDRRVHRNQSVEALSRMSFGILSTFFNRLQKRSDCHLDAVLHSHHIALQAKENIHQPVRTEILTIERPPMIEIEEYRAKFYPNN
ncbi:MAG: glucosyl-3-phosphoglycerate synthase [Spirochaetes bacterium]|nr:glucosyl-3-phosphoglycerate synthase [Spirochaetota bacterium]